MAAVHNQPTAHPQPLSRSAAAQQALGLAAQQRHALRAVNATAAQLMAARYAAQQAQQVATAAQLHGSGYTVPGRGYGSAKAALAYVQVRAQRAQVALQALAAAQAALRRAQRAHTLAIRGACAVGLPRVQVPQLAYAQARRYLGHAPQAALPGGVAPVNAPRGGGQVVA